MTEPNHILTHHEVVSNAGKARAAKLSPERRRKIAIKACHARGTKNLPKATHDGCIEIGDKKIDCWVLKGGIRVISSVAIRTALGLAHKNYLKPYLEKVFDGGPDLIYFTGLNGQKTEGVEASYLPKICEAYLKLRDEQSLSIQQKKIVLAADVIMRALAHVGITALVDEATGFQEERARTEDIGQPALEKHLLQVGTLLKISQTKDDFNKYFEKMADWAKEK